MSTVRRANLPGSLAPYAALALTVAIADGVPLWAWLPLYAALAMVALAVLSAVFVDTRNRSAV